MNIETVRYCHQLCCESYEPAAKDFFEIVDLRAGVRFDGNTVFITVRGTENATNWLRSLHVLPTRSPRRYLAHAGFVKAFRQMLPHIMLKLYALPKAPVVCTGHSLGGAVAVLLAEQFRAPVVTFGSPRVYHLGGGVPNLHHSRFVRDDDPVPDLPDFRFQHDCNPLVIKDADHALWDVEDHKLAGYLPKELN